MRLLTLITVLMHSAILVISHNRVGTSVVTNKCVSAEGATVKGTKTVTAADLSISFFIIVPANATLRINEAGIATHKLQYVHLVEISGIPACQIYVYTC